MSNENSNVPNLGLLTAHYLKNSSILVKKLTRKAGTEWDAEDIVQDAYERAIKYYSSYDPEKQQFGAWLNRIIMNAIKDHLRNNRGFAEVEFDEELAEGTPCESYTDKISEEIRDKIHSRKEHIAEILEMYFERGYSAKDISKLVETSHVAIHQIIYRFREELKKEYKDGNSISA